MSEVHRIREAVFARAADACESCGVWLDYATGHLDHVWGRKHAAQAVENCWFLCSACDYAKTRNSPSAAYWVGRWLKVARLHGYVEQEKAALTRLEVLKVRGFA